MQGTDLRETLPYYIDVSLEVDGVTRFTFEDKVYFYASDRNVAAVQLKAWR